MNYILPNTNLFKQYTNRQEIPNNNDSNTTSKGNIHSKIQFKSQTPKTPPVKTSIFYVNDLHGQNITMERLLNAANRFDSFVPAKNDKMKFASGDIMLGEDEKQVQVASRFLNLAGFMATALGNHECDMPTSQFVNLIKDKKYKLLGLNLAPSKDNPINKYIEKSYVQEINGNKYGIIGLVPSDLPIHVKVQEHLPDLHVEADFDNCVNIVQQEVDKFKSQGINKVIILSHSGYKQDVKLAKNVRGIDIILGAHTHNLLEGIEENKNLFYSPDGDPVVITQAGRDGKHFGILNVEFDNQGVITKVQNNIGKTKDFNRSLIARKEFEQILGKPEVVGKLDYVEKFPKDMYFHENAHCNFIMDAMKDVLGTDIALMNAGNIRGQFESGRIDTRDLAVISPFANKVLVVDLPEDEIVTSIKRRIEASAKSSSHRPGVVQISGLKYSFNNKGELLSMSFVDKNNNETPIDVNNPRKDKMYSVATDDFCLKMDDGGLGLKHRLDTVKKMFDYDKDVVVAQYIKKQTSPISIKSDGRIVNVDEKSEKIS